MNGQCLSVFVSWAAMSLLVFACAADSARLSVAKVAEE